MYVLQYDTKRNSSNSHQIRNQFPVISLTGPRQSGKTTLLRSIYKDIPYVSLEDIDIRNTAINDPRGFLSSFPYGAVLDKVQLAPPRET
jgi:predicted AAA+ superfamily ATPase